MADHLAGLALTRNVEFAAERLGGSRSAPPQHFVGIVEAVLFSHALDVRIVAFAVGK